MENIQIELTKEEVEVLSNLLEQDISAIDEVLSGQDEDESDEEILQVIAGISSLRDSLISIGKKLGEILTPTKLQEYVPGSKTQS